MYEKKYGRFYFVVCIRHCYFRPPQLWVKYACFASCPKSKNIYIGTKSLKQKCFGHKTNFFNTHSNFQPANKNIQIELYPMRPVPRL